jgi:hypothetical protein
MVSGLLTQLRDWAMRRYPSLRPLFDDDKPRHLLRFDSTRDKFWIEYHHGANGSWVQAWIQELKADAPGRLEKVRRLEFNQFCDHSFLERCLNEHISGAYTRHVATCPGRNVGCYCWHHKPPFKCVAQFPGVHTVDFWFDAPFQVHQSLFSRPFKNIQESQIVEIFKPLLETYFELHKGWFVEEKVPEVQVFYKYRHRRMYNLGYLANHSKEQKLPNTKFGN